VRADAAGRRIRPQAVQVDSGDSVRPRGGRGCDRRELRALFLGHGLGLVVNRGLTFGASQVIGLSRLRRMGRLDSAGPNRHVEVELWKPGHRPFADGNE